MTRAPRTIVAPVTLSADSTEIVSVAAALAEALGAELVLVGIAPLAPPVRAAAQAENITQLAPDDEQRLLDRLVSERLDELGGGLPAGVRSRTILTYGPLGAALVATARDEQAELIVVEMRRESALGHALHDHADRHVLHHSDVPVLVVPTHRCPLRATLTSTVIPGGTHKSSLEADDGRASHRQHRCMPKQIHRRRRNRAAARHARARDRHDAAPGARRRAADRRRPASAVSDARRGDHMSATAGPRHRTIR